MSPALNFQQVILKLHEFWASHDCVICEPYNVQVGAGTGNPATLLKVLGPEPWRAAYVEPSVRPDDGRFGQNPNRMQKYYQYQVILKPDPGNPQELYLASLDALGISRREHDIRFVEDNWESPALGAWGLGWEVWLDGQEITQFTYFQQAGGLPLAPVSVEITYGIERIALALQGRESAWAMDWLDGLSYADLMFNEELEHCRYYFDVADVEALRQVYGIYEREYARALEGDALIAAYDYVLKCSHLFNVLDTRGAVGVTERANYFRRMREMARSIAKAYVAKRGQLGHPLMKMAERWRGFEVQCAADLPAAPPAAADVLLEIGVEELPAADAAAALRQARRRAPILFDELRLERKGIEVYATPRRIVVIGRQVAPRQRDEVFIAKGPPADRAFDADGNPTRAARGFAKSKGLDVADLEVREMDGGRYVTARVRHVGRPTTEALAERLPAFIGGLKFGKTMRWNETGTAFSRPVRWLAALFGDAVIPFEFAGLASGDVTRGLRPYGSPETKLTGLESYLAVGREQGIILDDGRRRAVIEAQAETLAAEVGGRVAADGELLAEVTNLVEAPMAFRGSFEAKYLELPRDVLVTVMRKHQRYFAVEDADGRLMNHFIGVRNGDGEHLDKVVRGNEHVIGARFSDAVFFYQADIQKSLEDCLPRLGTLMFQADLGSMLEKSRRVAGTIAGLGKLLGFAAADIDIAQQAAPIAKADLATNMVVEMTSLQGIMGREYALKAGRPAAVADAIFEHWLPRGAGDRLPASNAGRLLALADKLDSLLGLFAVGLAPKSTSDPYGLRRTTLGIVQILVDGDIEVDLRRAIQLVAASQPVEVGPGIERQVFDFIGARLAAWLGDEHGCRPDVIRAVLKAQAHNPAGAVRGVKELSQWVSRGDWEEILDSFARCARMTAKEETQDLRPELLDESQERALHQAFKKASAQIADMVTQSASEASAEVADMVTQSARKASAQIADMVTRPASEASAEVADMVGNVGDFLEAFEKMIPAIGDFFDHVLVHTDDVERRQNRIALLQKVSGMQDGRADLSELDNF